MTSPIPAPYDAAASYRDFGQQLLRMIQSGQITPQRANELKAPVFEAVRLGNTPEGQQAMRAAIDTARDVLPMKGYDPAAMYRNIGSQLANAIKSGQMTVQQAQQLQAPLFDAVKLGNTAGGWAQMTSAYNRAIDAIRNASPAQPQGGLTQAQQPQSPVMPPQEIVVSQPPMPQPPEREVIGYPKPDYLSGIGSFLANLGKGMGNAPMQPKFIGQHFTGDAPPPGKKYIETPEGLVPVPINDVPVKPAMGPGLGRALGMPMQGVGMAPQMPQGMTLSNVPRQFTQEEILGITSMPQRPQGVGMAPQMPMKPQGLTLSNVPQQPPQLTPVSAPIKQLGMAMGGLMNKYYGGGEC